MGDLRIWFVIAESRGGIGEHVASVSRRLADAGHAVTVAAPSGTLAAFDFGSARLHSGNGGPTDSDPADVVHAHGYRAGLRALGWRSEARVRGAVKEAALVVSWHNDLAAGPLSLTGLAARTARRLVARGADLTLGASGDLVEAASLEGARFAALQPVAAPRVPPVLLTNADRVRARVRDDLRVGPSDPVILAVGRLAPQKDYPTFVRAANRIADRVRRRRPDPGSANAWQSRTRPDPVFWVAGAGDAEVAGRLTGDALPDTDLRLLGARDDVPELMIAADVLLLTSRWEARPLVVQQAVQCGLPVVATAVGGIPELVGDTALLAPAGDDAALAENVVSLLEDADLADRLRVRARTRAAGWPDEDQVAKELLDRYRRLLHNRSDPR